VTDIADVFVFDTTSEFLHTFRGLDLHKIDMLRADTRIGELRTGLDMILVDGTRLAVQYDAELTVVSLHRTDDKLSATALRNRLRAWAGSVLKRVDDTEYQQSYESVKDDLIPNIPTAEAFRQMVRDGMPRFGRHPLEDCFKMVDSRLFPTGGHPDSGSPWHNLTHLF
jgi:hypothetical protein